MWWNNVESKPFGGYPNFWDVKLLEMLGPQPGLDTALATPGAPYGVYAGKTIYEAAPAGQEVLGYLPEERAGQVRNLAEEPRQGPPGTAGGRDGPGAPVHYLVREEEVALPLYAQFGTEPNVYYIPPRWAPRKYLKQLFGPGVDRAIERDANPSPERPRGLPLLRGTPTLPLA